MTTHRGDSMNWSVDLLHCLMAQLPVHDGLSLHLYCQCCSNPPANLTLLSVTHGQDSKIGILCFRQKLTPNPVGTIHCFGLRRSWLASHMTANFSDNCWSTSCVSHLFTKTGRLQSYWQNCAINIWTTFYGTSFSIHWNILSRSKPGL